jgi:hypothetical protein
MIKKIENLIILSLSVAMTITRNIVRDVQTLLDSSKELGLPLCLSFFQNIFLLNNNPNWLFMTNLLPPPALMCLCVLVTPRKMKLHFLLKPKIILLLKRKLMINLIHRLRLPMVLFISNDLFLIHSFTHLLTTSFISRHLTHMQVQLKTTTM